MANKGADVEVMLGNEYTLRQVEERPRPPGLPGGNLEVVRKTR